MAERDGAVTPAALAERVDVPEDALAPRLERLRETGWLARSDGAYATSAQGADAYRRLVAARRERLEELLGDWTPEAHHELAALISRLARDLVAEDSAARPAA